MAEIAAHRTSGTTQGNITRRGEHTALLVSGEDVVVQTSRTGEIRVQTHTVRRNLVAGSIHQGVTCNTSSAVGLRDAEAAVGGAWGAGVGTVAVLAVETVDEGNRVVWAAGWLSSHTLRAIGSTY